MTDAIIDGSDINCGCSLIGGPALPSNSVFLDFEFWDLPGGRYDVEHLDNLDLQTVGACLFVIDAQVSQKHAKEDSQAYVLLNRPSKEITPIKRESQ